MGYGEDLLQRWVIVRDSDQPAGFKRADSALRWMRTRKECAEVTGIDVHRGDGEIDVDSLRRREEWLGEYRERLRRLSLL